MNLDQSDKSIISNLYLKELDIIWGLLKYISTLGTGTIVAWYIIREEFLYSSFLLIVSSFFQLLLLLLIRRHAVLVERYRAKILDLVTKTPLKEPKQRIFGFKLRGHVIQRLFPFTLIFLNLSIILYSSLNGLYTECCAVDLVNVLLLLFFSFAAFLGLIILFFNCKKLLIDPLYKK